MIMISKEERNTACIHVSASDLSYHTPSTIIKWLSIWSILKLGGVTWL